ncbi:hypothetical protein FAEPRAA2165_03197 [Faecalibacterium duncaniae]|uniref:Uncharacterized protein n=1 Tax=Faecalibacterium duncaniae (strain DSM 17677 / JCM 31915 / A2-165) TaxID=411483 RepID=C7HA43_FAED2|nr:hypothetical protein FAEPRAA2165_03197 [Faecalibacterium duncaniae]
MCKSTFANWAENRYNDFVQRVALMRKTGCMSATSFFCLS